MGALVCWRGLLGGLAIALKLSDRVSECRRRAEDYGWRAGTVIENERYAERSGFSWHGAAVRYRLATRRPQVAPWMAGRCPYGACTGRLGGGTYPCRVGGLSEKSMGTR